VFEGSLVLELDDAAAIEPAKLDIMNNNIYKHSIFAISKQPIEWLDFASRISIFVKKVMVREVLTLISFSPFSRLKRHVWP
jgi:hypothetical protein